MKKPMKIVLAAALALSVVLTALACSNQSAANSLSLGTVTNYRSDTSQPLSKDGPAPDFQLTMPDGRTVFLNELRGNVVLLNFWGVNCPYCVKEMPYLQKAFDELSSRGVIILGINTGDAEKAVRKFVIGNKITFPIILDPKVYASTLYDARYLPTTILIDKTGNIRSGRIGAYENADQVTAEITDLLQ